MTGAALREGPTDLQRIARTDESTATAFAENLRIVSTIVKMLQSRQFVMKTARSLDFAKRG